MVGSRSMQRFVRMNSPRALGWPVWWAAFLLSAAVGAAADSADRASDMADYFDRMCEPKPFVIREGPSFASHQAALRRRVAQCVGLWPWPERGPLEAEATAPLDHPWCRIQRVYYRI